MVGVGTGDVAGRPAVRYAERTGPVAAAQGRPLLAVAGGPLGGGGGNPARDPIRSHQAVVGKRTGGGEGGEQNVRTHLWHLSLWWNAGWK